MRKNVEITVTPTGKNERVTVIDGEEWGNNGHPNEKKRKSNAIFAARKQGSDFK